MNAVKFRRKYFCNSPKWTASQFPNRENQQELLKIPFNIEWQDMKELRIKLSSKDEENINKLKEKYGYKSTEDLFRFLVTIFAQHYVEFLWGINETEKNAKDEFYKKY